MSQSLHDKFCTVMLRHFYQDLCEMAERWQTDLMASRAGESRPGLDSDSLGVSMCSESTTQADLDEQRGQLERAPSADCASSRTHNLDCNLSRSDLETIGAELSTSELACTQDGQDHEQPNNHAKQQDSSSRGQLSARSPSDDICDEPSSPRVEPTGNRSKWHVIAVSISA